MSRAPAGTADRTPFRIVDEEATVGTPTVRAALHLAANFPQAGLQVVLELRHRRAITPPGARPDEGAIEVLEGDDALEEVLLSAPDPPENKGPGPAFGRPTGRTGVSLYSASSRILRMLRQERKPVVPSAWAPSP